MSCFNPRVRITKVNRYTGETSPKIMLYKNFDPKTLNPYEEFQLIPCGECDGCHADNARKWRDRILMEAYTAKSAYFITLTYDNEHLPHLNEDDISSPGILKYMDFQKFMKRLRINALRQGRLFDNPGSPVDDRGHKLKPFLPLRLFMCGEYGSNYRPHYHAIIFNLNLDPEKDFIQRGRTSLGSKDFDCPFIAETWSDDKGLIGRVSIGSVTGKSASYVAGYVNKKFMNNEQCLALKDCPRPFIQMSRRPGLGYDYYKEFGLSFPDCVLTDDENDIPLPDDHIYIPSHDSAPTMASVPRYFKNMFEKEDPLLYYKYKQKLYFASKLKYNLESENGNVAKHLLKLEMAKEAFAKKNKFRRHLQ